MDGKSFESEEAIKIRLRTFLIHFPKQNDFFVHRKGVALKVTSLVEKLCYKNKKKSFQ